ncbi:MAG TPA: M20/M25/M40 family metallo-hydrolase [Intrasporangium sp.]|uniref:M20/M25/M40 family metallo-hydrolase n=1 Tax=Intrasporangium sp. TaxID=1925024 RepID=UPI002D79EC7D|nr:M20/M25/M40 family metallo-hydrolase [Intrasporangium sp.]HET7397637.1 M20/M25/M40 family metallo-hydrolase [Intrasporangium sp.]
MTPPLQPEPTAAPPATSSDEPAVALLCSELIRHDSSVRGPFERGVAERVAAELSSMSLRPVLLEPEPRRSNVVARIEGTDPTLPALLVHIHLDVVPADPSAWTVPPHSGELRDGYVWGRGAVDMKNMAAMTLEALRCLLAGGWRPRRDVVLAFVADEELGGGLGARWLVEHHRDLLEGCTEAIGEAGGFSYEYAPGRRAYLVQSGEKGIGWLRLVARGSGGHGSMLHTDNPVIRLSEALQRLERHDFGVLTCETTSDLVAAAKTWHGAPDGESALHATGPLAKLLVPVLRNTYNATELHAGLQHNVVPPVAEALVDGRFVPGHEAEFYSEIEELLGDLVAVEPVFSNAAVETAFTGAVPDAIVAALAAEDPHGVTVPTCLPIGTDAKHFATLGMKCFGFVPLQLPSDFDFPTMFHGADERVPVSALCFGQRVLERFFRAC